MKLVTAVIKPHKWEDVREALAGVGACRRSSVAWADAGAVVSAA